MKKKQNTDIKDFATRLENREERLVAIRNQMIELSAMPNNQALIFPLIAEIGSILLFAFHNREVTYDQNGVIATDEYINAIRTEGADHTATKEAFSCFIGECLIKTYAGSWESEDGEWYVRITDKLSAYPANWVSKRFENGEEDCLLGKFISIAIVLAQRETLNN